MPLTPEVLGQRLREARQNRGFSQNKAATVLNVPRTAISQIESGNRAVSTLELAKLAELYQQSIADFFTETESEDDQALVALHRVAPDIAQTPEIDEHVTHCLNICRDGVELSKLLGRSLVSGLPTYSLGEMRSPRDAITQGTRVAEQERQRLDLGRAPIVDVAEIITNQGIWATSTPLPSEMSGFFLHHSSIGMVILINLDHPIARKRFSYAHEYGHALMDRDRTVTITTRANADELIEMRANAFAAAFLMPESGIRDFLQYLDKGQSDSRESQVFDVTTEEPIDIKSRLSTGSQKLTYQDIATIAYHFGASYRATTYRMKNLGIISLKQRDHLLNQEEYGRQYLELLKLDEFSDGANLHSNQKSSRQLQSQVIYLAIEAYRREEISRGRIHDIARNLDVPGIDLVELAEVAREDTSS